MEFKKATKEQLSQAEMIIQVLFSMVKPSTLRKDLRHMMDIFFLYHDNPGFGFKDTVYAAYLSMNSILRISVTGQDIDYFIHAWDRGTYTNTLRELIDALVLYQLKIEESLDTIADEYKTYKALDVALQQLDKLFFEGKEVVHDQQ
ncbi:MAG: hypothetical protein ACOYXB_00535 [Bacteroidota bacterium]